jgi:hypothetical protein
MITLSHRIETKARTKTDLTLEIKIWVIEILICHNLISRMTINMVNSTRLRR